MTNKQTMYRFISGSNQSNELSVNGSRFEFTVGELYQDTVFRKHFPNRFEMVEVDVVPTQEVVDNNVENMLDVYAKNLNNNDNKLKSKTETEVKSNEDEEYDLDDDIKELVAGNIKKDDSLENNIDDHDDDLTSFDDLIVDDKTEDVVEVKPKPVEIKSDEDVSPVLQKLSETLGKPQKTKGNKAKGNKK